MVIVTEGFFRPERSGGGLETSPLTKEIFAFVGGRG